MYALYHIELTSGGAGQTNGLLMNKKGKVTEIEVRNDVLWDVQKQFMEEVEFIPT